MNSPETMQTFLLWLGEDERSGARRYEDIRRKLILLFRVRGCHIPEDLADETIDRTAHAVLKPGFQYQGDPIAYFRGVAHNVYREWLRKEARFRTEPIEDGSLELPAPTDESTVLLTDCFDLCLNGLMPTKKTLLIRYYGADKRAKIDDRLSLANELGIGLNTLRLQIFRLRNRLRECVEACSKRGDTELAKRS